MYIDYDIRMFVGNFVLTIVETQELQNLRRWTVYRIGACCSNTHAACFGQEKKGMRYEADVTTLLFIFVSSLICSHAVVHPIYFDWEELGARKIGVNAVKTIW